MWPLVFIHICSAWVMTASHLKPIFHLIPQYIHYCIPDFSSFLVKCSWILCGFHCWQRHQAQWRKLLSRVCCRQLVQSRKPRLPTHSIHTKMSISWTTDSYYLQSPPLHKYEFLVNLSKISSNTILQHSFQKKTEAISVFYRVHN